MSAKKPTQKPKGWGKFVSLSNDRGVTLKGVPRFTWPHLPLSCVHTRYIWSKGREGGCISLVRWLFFFIELYCPKHGSLPNPPSPPPPPHVPSEAFTAHPRQFLCTSWYSWVGRERLLHSVSAAVSLLFWSLYGEGTQAHFPNCGGKSSLKSTRRVEFFVWRSHHVTRITVYNWTFPFKLGHLTSSSFLI